MRRSFRFVVATLVCCFAVGCHNGHYDVAVSFGSGVTPTEVRYIELVLLPQCPSVADVASGQAPTGTIVAGVGLSKAQGGALPALPAVAPGSYGLYARGFDASCNAIAAGCVPVQVEAGGSRPLAVELDATTRVDACTGSGICTDGRCTSPVADAGSNGDGAVGDGAVSDGAVSTDAGMDGSSCHPSCATCSGSGASQCTSCRTSGGGTLAGGVCTYTCTLAPSDDGMAWSYPGNGSTGTASTMQTSDDGSSHYYSFLRFDVASGACSEGGTIPTGSTITSAKLTLHWESGCPSCGRAHELRAVTATWTEASIAAGTGPAASATVTSTVTLPTTSPANVDLTGGSLVANVQSFLANPSTNYGWRFGQTPGTSNNASPYVWTTRENAGSGNAPHLVVTYHY